MADNPGITEELFAARAKELEWLIFDVDGVLTDGTLYYGPEGELMKPFSVRDGLAFRVAQRSAKLKLAILTGRSSPIVTARAEELDFDWVRLGSRDKGADLDSLLGEHEITDERCAYIGDDVQDLPVLMRVGLSFAPADADPEVRKRVDVVLETPGGKGAAREMVERLLEARGEWQGVVDYFLP